VVTEVAVGYISPSFKEVIAFGVLVVVLLIRPQGIFGQAAGERDLA
jgi:branched-chain amino acid transport system permease protein